MKHIKYFESSLKASEYKFRKENLLPEVKDILSKIDIPINSEVLFENNSLSAIRISIFHKKDWKNYIEREEVYDSIHHSIEYLKFEKFKLTFVNVSCDTFFPKISKTLNIDDLPDKFDSVHFIFKYQG